MSPLEIMFLVRFVIEISKNQKMQVSELLKNNLFLHYSHLTVLQQYKLRKTTKKTWKGAMTQWPPTASQNDPKLKTPILA